MELETLQALHVDEQARRLQAICRSLGVSPKGKKCVGMEGLLKEASELIRERPDRDVLDAGREELSGISGRRSPCAV